MVSNEAYRVSRGQRTKLIETDVFACAGSQHEHEIGWKIYEIDCKKVYSFENKDPNFERL